MVFTKISSIHFYGRVRGKCYGRLQNWPGIVNERPKFLAGMPTTLSPSPGLSALAHSNRMPQRMYASVPRCMPFARLGLIHNTMPSHNERPSPKALSMCGCVVCMCVCMRVHMRVTKGELKACVIYYYY